MRFCPIVLSVTAARFAWFHGYMAYAEHVLKPVDNVSFEAMMMAAAVAGVSTGTTTTSSNHPQLSTEFFLVPSSPAHAYDKNYNVASVASVVSVPAPNQTISIQQTPRFPTDSRMPGYSVTTDNLYRPTILRQRSWALPLAATGAAAMILMAAFEIFVLLKARAAAPSQRHLFLGQALLLGLFLLTGLSSSASLAPNPLSCAAFRLVGLPAALVFAALLVKCVFLLSLNSGIYLPAPYQALVLIFAVLVQVAIVGQWFYSESPVVLRPRIIEANTSFVQSYCKTPVGQTVVSLGYPGILLLAVICLAIRARGVRDNFREAAFIGLAVGLTLPVWLISGVGSIIAGENDREAWLAFGLLSMTLIVFLTMFLPKGRQLAALGKDRPGGMASAMAGGTTVVIRDHDDDRLSSLPGSRYSPSFFHFKPTEVTSKKKSYYQSTDRVALVSSGMPGCSACRHGGSPVYSEDMQSPVETYVLPHGMYLQGSELDVGVGNLYTTLSANPNVFFQRAHSGMIY